MGVMETDLNAHLAAQGIKVQEQQPEPTKVQPEQTVEQTPQATPEGTQQEAQTDLMTRVSQFVKEKGPESESTDSNTDVKFDYSELDSVDSPEKAREWAEKAYKSMQRGYNEKFQDIAGLRKELQATNEANKGWTPERVQSLLNDREFVNAAEQVYSNQNPQASGLTDDQYSSLTDSDKQSLHLAIANSQKAQQEVNLMKQTRDFERQDLQLSQKYSNYDPAKVDGLYDDMVSGKVNANREALWQVLDYEPAVNRAYELGLKDGQKNGSEMSNSVSVEGRNIISSAPLQKEEGESGRNYFKRLAERNLKNLQGAK
jgi:hypothetical protein